MFFNAQCYLEIYKKLPGHASKNVVGYSPGIFSFKERTKNGYSAVLMNSYALFFPPIILILYQVSM